MVGVSGMGEGGSVGRRTGHSRDQRVGEEDLVGGCCSGQVWGYGGGQRVGDMVRVSVSGKGICWGPMGWLYSILGQVRRCTDHIS